MAEIVAEFFQVIGADVYPPETLGELFPYLLRVLVGVCLVSGVFAVIGKLGEVILNYTRFR